MKHSKLNLVVLALVALSASSYAQSAGRGVGQRPDGRPNVDYRQDNSRSARSFDVVIRELENAIRKMRCALPVYQGRRSDALKDTMRILDQLREPDRSWPGNYFSQRDREDYVNVRQYREFEIRQSNTELLEASRSLKCAIDLIDKMSSRNDRWSDRLIDGLEDAQRDIKLALVQAERFRGYRSDDRWDGRGDSRRGDDRRDDDRRDGDRRDADRRDGRRG